MSYAAVPSFSVFEFEYPQFCAELRAALKTQGALSPEDDHFLKDGADGRHKHATMQRVMRLAAQSDRPEHHEMLSEIVRPLGAAPRCVATVFDAETMANGDANLAQIQFERVPCKSTAQRVRETLMRQMSTTRWALDVVSSKAWQ